MCLLLFAPPHDNPPSLWRERGIQFPQHKNKHTSQARGDEARKAEGGGERNLHLVFRGRWTIARGPSHTPFNVTSGKSITLLLCFWRRPMVCAHSAHFDDNSRAFTIKCVPLFSRTANTDTVLLELGTCAPANGDEALDAHRGFPCAVVQRKLAQRVLDLEGPQDLHGQQRDLRRMLVRQGLDLHRLAVEGSRLHRAAHRPLNLGLEAAQPLLDVPFWHHGIGQAQRLPVIGGDGDDPHLIIKLDVVDGVEDGREVHLDVVQIGLLGEHVEQHRVGDEVEA
eukprot:scaffold13613_cov112-Isochrysis_galbana.AAC.1